MKIYFYPELFKKLLEEAKSKLLELQKDSNVSLTTLINLLLENMTVDQMKRTIDSKNKN